MDKSPTNTGAATKGGRHLFVDRLDAGFVVQVEVAVGPDLFLNAIVLPETIARLV